MSTVRESLELALAEAITTRTRCNIRESLTLLDEVEAGERELRRYLDTPDQAVGDERLARALKVLEHQLEDEDLWWVPKTAGERFYRDRLKEFHEALTVHPEETTE